MKKEERESIEWTNTWWSEANKDSKRGLLIGDSTTRQLRGSIEVLLKNVYAIDLFASSFSIYDSRLADSINILFKGDDYQYDFIVLNYGGHHGFSRMCSTSAKEYKTYQKAYGNLLKYLMNNCEKVICVTGTSEVLDTDVNTIDMEIEHEVVARNRIVLETASENCIEVFHLYDLMSKNRGVYTYTDRQHFGRDSDYFISYHLLEFMLSKNILNKEFVNNQRMQDRDTLTKILGRDRKYIIYGAGLKAGETYWKLKWYGLEHKISCFAVSNKIEKDRMFGIPVMLISELEKDAYENDMLIISSDNYKEEMHKIAEGLQIQHVIFYCDIFRGL